MIIKDRPSFTIGKISVPGASFKKYKKARKGFENESNVRIKAGYYIDDPKIDAAGQAVYDSGVHIKLDSSLFSCDVEATAYIKVSGVKNIPDIDSDDEYAASLLSPLVAKCSEVIAKLTADGLVTPIILHISGADIVSWPSTEITNK